MNSPKLKLAVIVLCILIIGIMGFIWYGVNISKVLENTPLSNISESTITPSKSKNLVWATSVPTKSGLSLEDKNLFAFNPLTSTQKETTVFMKKLLARAILTDQVEIGGCEANPLVAKLSYEGFLRFSNVGTSSVEILGGFDHGYIVKPKQEVTINVSDIVKKSADSISTILYGCSGVLSPIGMLVIVSSK